jgi:hypothetical protein
LDRTKPFDDRTVETILRTAVRAESRQSSRLLSLTVDVVIATISSPITALTATTRKEATISSVNDAPDLER